MKNLFATLLMAACLGFGVPAFAEEAAPAAADAAPAAAEAEAMAKMMEMMQPGEMHKMLESLAGSWTYESVMQMTPEAPVEKSSGKSENKIIYEGRFLVSRVEGTMKMGDKEQPFEGQSIMGYDTIGKTFQNIWMDNISTGMMVGTGTYDEASKMIAEKAYANCPLVGGKRDYRNELKIIDADHYSYVMYTTDASGKEFKMMDIQYTRVK